MFFKKKSKIEQSQPKPQQKPATIQERMTEVYNLAGKKNATSLVWHMNCQK